MRRAVAIGVAAAVFLTPGARGAPAPPVTQKAPAPVPAAAPPAHALTAAAEKLYQEKHPRPAVEIAAVAALASPDVMASDLARLHLLLAALRLDVKDEVSARREIGEALRKDPFVSAPAWAPARVRELLEIGRSFMPAQAGRPPAPPPARPSAPATQALVKVMDTLYRGMHVDAAAVVLQVARQEGAGISPADQVELALREGILHEEAADDVAARKAFRKALEANRAAKLPDYAPPKTVRAFEEVRGALPPAPPPPETAAPPPKLKPWKPWRGSR